jgi:hypothetical protein
LLPWRPQELTDAEAREQREDEYTALKSMFGDDVIRTDQNGMVAVTFNRGPAEETELKPAGYAGLGLADRARYWTAGWPI